MNTPIGVTLTADDRQLLAVLNSVEGKLDALAASSGSSFGKAGTAATQAAARVKGLETQTGMSTRAMSAAMRNVPAQFTDIITSLQGGQAPLTVLLQQGGQLKDMFGGVLPAFRALGGYVLGLINPFTLLAGAAALMGGSFLAGRNEAAVTQRQLILTGGAAGATAGEMQSLAAQLDEVGGATQGRAAEVLNQMAAAGITGSVALRNFTNTAIELERAGGPAVEETAKAFAALGKDPVQASIDLNKQTGFLTLAVFDQIKALQSQGRTSEAAALAQAAYANEMDRRLPALKAQLGYVESMWRSVADGAKEAWDAMLGVGRPDTTLTKLELAQRKLKASQEGIYSRDKVPQRAQDVRDLSRRVVIEAEIASAQEEQTRQTKAAIGARQELTRFDERALTSAQKMQREIAEYRRNVEAVRAGGGMVDPEQVAKVEAAITESYAKTTNSARKYNDATQDTTELILRLSGFTRQYATDAALIDAAYAKGQISRERALQLQRELLAMQPAIKAANEAEASAIEARNKALQAAEDEVDAYLAAQLNAQGAAAKAAEAALAAAGQEFASHGKLRSEIAQTTLLRMQDALAAETLGTTEYASIYRQIEAQKKLVEVLQRGEARDAAAETAKAAGAEWQKVIDSIGQGLTDSLFRAFEAGKGFFSTLWDGIKNTMKTTVLKVALEPVQKGMGTAASSIMGGLSSGFTGGASASGGGGGSDIASMGSMLGSLGSMAGGFAGDVVGSMIGAGTSGTGIIGSSASASLAAAGPYIAVALALYAAYKLLNKKKTPHLGSVVGVGADGKASTMYGDPSGILNNFHKETDDALRGMGGATVGSLNSLSTAFGGTGGFAGEFKFAADGADQSIGSALFSRNGQALAGGVGSTSQFAFYDKDREAAFTAFTGDVASATLAALDGVALPKWAREQFAKLGSGATIEQFAALSDAVTATQSALRGLQTEVSPLGGVFARVAGLSGDALKQLTDFAGGIDAFGQKVGSYVKSYYSEDEQAALSAASLQRSLAGSGVSLDGLTARNSFRSLVDGTDVGSEGGRQQLSALLNASEQFAGLSGYLEKSGLTFGQLAALAPSIGALGDLNAGASKVDGLALVGSAVTASGDNVVSAIEALQTSVDAALAAIAKNTAATTNQLNRWDDGGALLTTSDGGGA